MAEEKLEIDPLFVGLTRPTSLGGVTIEVFIFNGFLSVILFMAMGNPLYMFIGIPIHFACKLVCAKEPRYFTLLAQYLTTSSKCRNRFFWKAVSYSPLEVSKENTNVNKQNKVRVNQKERSK